MKIFIGSSRESLETVREIEYWLQEKGHEPVPWDKPGLFMPGDQTFLTLISIAGSVDGAIFVFAEDDAIWYRGDGATQPRDNVLVEYGLFVGKLGPRKAVICRLGNPKHSEDLRGLGYIDLSEHVRAKGRFALNIWAGSLGESPQDPAILDLTSRIHQLKHQNQELEKRIKFETDKSVDLEKVIADQSGIDFSINNFDADGYWKLLFEYDFFEKTALIIAEHFKTPIQLREFVSEVSYLADLIAWYSPGDPNKNAQDASPEKRIFFSKKLLRLFRDRRNWEQFSWFIDHFPPEIKAKIRKVGDTVVGSKQLERDT